MVRRKKTFGVELYADEIEAIEQVQGEKRDSQVLREALALWCAAQGVEFPEHETQEQGGPREGAGRKSKNTPRD